MVHTKAACLSQMGFGMQDAFALDDIDAKEDMLVAETLLCLERNMFATELRNMRYYSDRPPMMFARLLHRDEAKRADAMACAKQLYEALLRLEAL